MLDLLFYKHVVLVLVKFLYFEKDVAGVLLSSEDVLSHRVMMWEIPARLITVFGRMIHPYISAKFAQRLPLDLLLKVLQLHIKNQRYKHIASISAYLPPDVVADILHYMNVEDAAKITEYCSLKSIEAIIPFLSMNTLYEISRYLSPEKVALMVNFLPEEKLRECVNMMLSKGMVAKLAEISDTLEYADLLMTTQRLGDPKSIATIVCHMKTYRKIARVTQALDVNLLTEILRYLLVPK